MVVICDVPTLSTGVMQDRAATPSTCTVQAPQSATPQPNLVPVMPRTSRNTQSSGVSPSTSTLWVFPLILMLKAMVFSLFAATHSAFGGDVDDSLGKGLGGFLRQIVPDATRDIPVRILAREFRGVNAGIWMRRSVRVTFKRNGRDGNDGAGGEAFFQVVEFGFAFGEVQAPSIIVDRDVDMVRIVERRRASIESRVVEIPLRRSELPDQLRELSPILLVAGAAAVGGKIELVPPFVLGLWRQGYLAGLLIADEIAAHRNHGLGALWPERCENVGGPRSPIKTGEGRLLDLESVKKVLEIHGKSRWLPIPDRFIREESRGAIAAQVRDDHPVAGRGQQRRNINKTVNVVRPAVQENDHWSVGGTGFSVTDIQDAGIDLLQRSEGRVCSWLDCRHVYLFSLCCCRIDHPELTGGDCKRGDAKEAASVLVDFRHYPVRIHWFPR